MKADCVINETIRGNGKLSLSPFVLRAVISAAPNRPPSDGSRQSDNCPEPDDHFINARFFDGVSFSPWVTIYSHDGSRYPRDSTGKSVTAGSGSPVCDCSHSPGRIDSSPCPPMTVDVDTLLFSGLGKVNSELGKEASSQQPFLEIDSSLGIDEEIHLAQWTQAFSGVQSWSDTAGYTDLLDSSMRLSGSRGGVSLEVPFRSQMVETKVPPRDICLPTSLAMVLHYYGVSVETAVIAKACYDEYHKIYGNWLRACYIAGSYGFKASIQAIHCLENLLPFLTKGLPLIVSIGYQKGELIGAPVEKSSGHLLVIRGVDVDGRILVCDPAGEIKDDGYISYDPVQFANALKGVAIIVEEAS